MTQPVSATKHKSRSLNVPYQDLFTQNILLNTTWNFCLVITFGTKQSSQQYLTQLGRNPIKDFLEKSDWNHLWLIVQI